MRLETFPYLPGLSGEQLGQQSCQGQVVSFVAAEPEPVT